MTKTLYGIFLGLMLVLFVGVGIATFYASPMPPQSPPPSPAAVTTPPSVTELEQADAAQQTYQAQQNAYQKAENTYERNVSLIAIGFAVVFLVIALWFLSASAVVADGLLLGSVFTLLYGIARGLLSQDNTQRFVVTTIGLLVALIIGYKRFATPAKPQRGGR